MQVPRRVRGRQRVLTAALAVFVVVLGVLVVPAGGASGAAGWKFSQSASVNPYWLQVTVTTPVKQRATKVEAIIDGSTWHELKREPWGDWTVNVSVGTNPKIVYRAWDTSGRPHDSATFTLSGTKSTSPTSSAPTSSATPKPAATPTPTAPPVAGGSSSGEPIVATQGKFPQWFHVKGNNIVNEANQEVIFRGVSTIDVNSFATVPSKSPDWWSEASFADMADWGASTIRLPIIKSRFDASGAEASYGYIDKALTWAAAHNMYVFLDYHGIGDPEASASESKQLIDFWAATSKRYANDPRVSMYELYNEPTGYGDWDADWNRHKVLMEKVISAIRVNDKKHMVAVGGTNYAYYNEPVLANPVNDSNVVYSSHPYPDKRDWATQIGQVKAKYPVYVTEMGFCTSANESFECVENWRESAWQRPGPGQYGNDIVNYLESIDVSWSVWAWSDIWAPPLLKDEGTLEPTAEGKFFRGKLRTLNGLP